MELNLRFKTKNKTSIFVFAVIFLLIIISCQKLSSPQPAEIDPNEIVLEGPWRETPYAVTSQWGHDGNVFKSTTFNVYSDGSSMEAKEILAELAEDLFLELIEEFKFTHLDEILPSADYKFFIYANMHHTGVRGLGFYNGIVVPAIDSQIDPFYANDPQGYQCEVKHELVHPIQFILINCNHNCAPYYIHVWFQEGQAVYMMGDQHWLSRFTTFNEYNQWLNSGLYENPISFRSNLPGGTFTDYYPMFGLAVAYLMDQEQGHGRTIDDIKVMFQYIKAGESFSIAFERVMSMTVDNFQENLYDLLDQYFMKINSQRRLN
jgi:hypothetical protein